MLPVGNLVQQGPVEATPAILIFVPIFAPIVSEICVGMEVTSYESAEIDTFN